METISICIWAAIPTMANLVGINDTNCFILSPNGEIMQQELNDSNQPIKLVLRKFSDMSAAESAELNNRGVSIGQRKG